MVKLGETIKYQLHLGETSPKKIVRFSPGTVIWPEDSGRGVLKTEINAIRLDEQICGLTGYRALDSFDTYFGVRKHHPEGTRFGSYSKKARAT